jgi:diguanylate cyclase (GGDEF)-like protein/PAS domain S-box-containing protein
VRVLVLGLRGRIALIASLVIVFAVVAITVAAGFDLTEDYQRALQGRSTAIAKSLRIQLDRVLQYGINVEDLSGFEEQCQETVRAYEGIGSAFVLSPSGTVLFHNDPRNMGRRVENRNLMEAASEPRESTVVTTFRGRVYHATLVPVIGPGGNHQASVVVTLLAEHVNAEMRELVFYGVGVGMAVLLLGIGLLLAALSRFVTSPLARLTGTVERIRRGEASFSERVPGAGPGEIGGLIAGFNRLLEHIQKRDEQLVSLEQLTRSEASLANAQELAHVGSWEWRLGQTDYWSGQMYRILGLDPAGTTPGFAAFLAQVLVEERAQVKEYVAAASRQGGKHGFEVRIRRPDGEERILYERAETTFDAEGRPVLVRGSLQDITESKQMEGRIRALAYYDSLTGLPNRTQFKERLARVLRKAERDGGRVAVMFLDLDRFKQINDSLGHPVGDELLKAVAARLGGCLRPDDDVGRAEDATARLGGDEFTVMLAGLERDEDAARVAARIVAAIARPFSIDGHELFVTASIGIAVHPGDGGDVDTLLKNADIAMYYAKDLGRNQYKFYSADLNARALERLTLERDLHRALERRELALHYQPQVDQASGRVTGVEALLRWRHPERGMLPPAQFIPIAEQTGLIAPIGEWVLGEACRQAKAWSDAGMEPLEMWVNVSGIQFRDRRLIGAVREALAASGLKARLLVLEATETIMLENREATLATLRELKRLGIGLAIDDFGTGYSSLAYLKRFPLDTLKIDGSFVRDLGGDGDDQAIVDAIIAMAKRLKLHVLAEGVETPQQAARLLQMGCYRMQGFYFSRPLPPEEITAFVTAAQRSKGLRLKTA